MVKFIMENYNAAIYLLSSRKDFLYTSLESFYKNWNDQYDYPVYVHYYDDIYDDLNFQKKFKRISHNIFFRPIEYKIPEHIHESELFYNRSYLEYVNSGRFTKDRIGYLHMQWFCTNLTGFGNINSGAKDLEQYDYLCRIDDDLYFKKKIKYDIFKFSENYPISSGSMWNVKKRELKNNPKHGNIETREFLFEFIKEYILENNFTVKNKQLKKAIDTNNEFLMHTLPWQRGVFIYNMSKYKTDLFTEYLERVYKFGGNYKHRWGDIEILALFNATHFEEKTKFLKLEKKGYYDPKFITSFAPSTKI